jgi:2-keto-4-pentenoate hydratase/2-oxohepta-3-ene-1,7-dioic acid hydratase in catechol pathway
MLLYRLAPDGAFAATDEEGVLRVLYSDPLQTRPGGWEFGRPIEDPTPRFLAPIVPGKIVGVGRNYAAHVKELDNAAPAEPVLFLKSPSSLIGPDCPIVLPPESERVEYEGEIALVLRATLRRAGAEQARHAILGVTCANDVTARDLQKKDPTFARAKSFDTFCPLGPTIRVDPDLDSLAVETRVDGERRQRAPVAEMTWGIVDLLVYASRMMTLEPGDVVLTGTPSGVAPMRAGQVVEVEVPGVGTLRNPVEEWRR